MVAYHFPPLAGSSGIQRTLRFVQHLPSYGWQPLLLSAHPRAYERTSADQLADIPAGTVVERAQAWDAARHLSIGGRYLGASARPDRWASWRFDAVRRGLQMIERYRPQVIWSTYPIATAHRIGHELQRRSGLPWVADFRDPMAQDGYPADPATWRAYERVEKLAVASAAASIFVTPGALRLYQHRYPAAAARMQLIENGYDEDSFAAVQAQLGAGRDQPLLPGCVTLLHSGVVYPSERDPTQLFVALRQLHDAGGLQPGRLRVRFRAAVSEDLLRRLAEEHGVQAYVEIAPPIPYREALGEMMRADGLLLLQAANCNEQVPVKLYEYLRAGRPVVCLSDDGGDTAATLRAAGCRWFGQLDDDAGIQHCLREFLAALTTGRAGTADPEVVRSATRYGRAGALATLLNRCVS